jgi:hypothetical protein
LQQQMTQRPSDQHDHHAEHGDHSHGHDCGHESMAHDDHTDYMHDGHQHGAHDDHWDEHASATSIGNIDAVTADAP